MSPATADVDQRALESTRDELARVRENLGEFVYAASHDVAEPLAIVSGYARLLAGRCKDELDADGRQYLHGILEGIARAEDLIEDLRAFSRVEMRGGSFSSVSSEAAAIEAADLLGPAVEKVNAQVSVGSLPTVRGDEVQLVQLFRALLSNALKFRSREAPLIGIDADPAGPGWRFTVGDNGIGVPEQDRERIFRMFQHGDSSGGPGNGAGLAIARRIVERHGGTIWVEGAPDGGSLFRFTLPADGEGSE